LSELRGVQYATFLVKKELSLHRPVLIFQPTLNCRVSDNQSKLWKNRINQLGKCPVTKCLHVYIYRYL